MDFDRIVTHTDFDGVVSAAVCSFALGVDRFVFTSPGAVSRAEISIGPGDVVCDLPYPLECGLWFDHHPGSREALALRKIDPASIPGRLDETGPSCAGVALAYFAERGVEMPERLRQASAEADVLDSFDYRSIEEWRAETPGKIVDMAIKARQPSPREHTAFLDTLVRLARDLPLAEVAAHAAVAPLVAAYREDEKRMIDFLAKSTSWLPEDTRHELVILDFTAHARPPRVLKNLAYLVAPEALGVLVVSPVFRGDRKTNDLSFSMSLSMNLTGRDHGKDIGEIMRSLNIGDGHVGAAAGGVHCASKDEMLRAKKRTLAAIWKLWIAGQRPGKAGS